MFDFHCHSNHSDGELSPAELVNLAGKKELSGISITDHDVVSGIPEALQAGKDAGIYILPGIELSLGFMGGEIHLLGYNFDFKSRSFISRLKEAQLVRDERNENMIRKMRDWGLDVTYTDIQTIAHGEYPGRPHFARYLIKLGMVRTVKEAFDRFLGKDKPFYHPRNYIPLEEGIGMILDAGGIPVIAHPLSLNVSWTKLAGYLPLWKEMGVQGVEGYYSEHSEGKCRRLVNEAGKYGFLITGGSDFHGKSKPKIELGRTGGNRRLTAEMVEDFLMEIGYSPII